MPCHTAGKLRLTSGKPKILKTILRLISPMRKKKDTGVIFFIHFLPEMIETPE